MAVLIHWFKVKAYTVHISMFMHFKIKSVDIILRPLKVFQFRHTGLGALQIECVVTSEDNTHG